MAYCVDEITKLSLKSVLRLLTESFEFCGSEVLSALPFETAAAPVRDPATASEEVQNRKEEMRQDLNARRLQQKVATPMTWLRSSSCCRGPPRLDPRVLWPSFRKVEK